MTNDPHNPLPGEQPEDPRLSSGQGAGQPDPGMQPGPGPAAASQPPGSGAHPGYSSQAATPPERPAEPTRAQEVRPAGQPAGGPPPEPPRGGVNKMVALAGIAGLLAVVGIVTGLAVANNNNSTAAAVHPPPPPSSPTRPPAGKPRAPVRRGHLLATFSGVGTASSLPFKATNPAFVTYGFTCSSGTPHKFVASLATTSGGNHQSIANTSGTSASQTITLHPTATSSEYRISATSACPYTFRVYSSS